MGDSVVERHGEDDPRGRMTWPPGSPFHEVLSRARQLDRAALSLLYARFLPVVYRYTLARVRDTHHAEDLTSETFFAAIESIQRIRAEDELGFAAWILGIARNQIAMHFRRQRVRDVVSPVESLGQHSTTGEEGDPLDIITAREAWDEVAAALQTLTEEQQAVVLYRCVLGYSAEEVAQLLGKNAGAIRALQLRALGALSRVMSARTSDPADTPQAGAPMKSRRRGHAS
jgi:RNA polymerase sigma-70 factor (ECF subfamily)